MKLNEATSRLLVCANTDLYSGDKFGCHVIRQMNLCKLLSLPCLATRQTQDLQLWTETGLDT